MINISQINSQLNMTVEEVTVLLTHAQQVVELRSDEFDHASE